VSLARALVKDSKILILDEATASVDYETDRKIQDTITTEFHDRTILCIARTSSPAFPFHRDDFLTADHDIDRLRTIISYDRICVMDNGNIAEFDAPDVLHAQNGIFRAMCEHSSITLEDIRRARKERAVRDELEIATESGGAFPVRCHPRHVKARVAPCHNIPSVMHSAVG
jgi:ABC-type multidrug transport system ATPase subunit